MDTPVKSLNPNKHLKEQFVSNLSGSSMLELFSLTAVLSIVILLQRCFGFNSQPEALSKKDDNDNGFFCTKNLAMYIATLSLDFLYIVVPFILYTTVLADWTYINTTIVALLVLLCILAGRFGSFFQEDGAQSLRQNISSYRVSMMLLTCLCILAVDFKIFPRRYAKTETYGTSLMDLGVGSFVLANSLVSRQARGISTLKISNSLRSTSPLIFLGFARLISTSSVDYQVHVGEYGVHWNFFFTLAGVAILTSIINVPPNYCGILGLLILLGMKLGWLGIDTNQTRKSFLVSWLTPSVPASCPFALGLDSHNKSIFKVWSRGSMSQEIGFWDGHSFRFFFQRLSDSYSFTFVSNKKEIYLTFNTNEGKNMSWFALTSSGEINEFTMLDGGVAIVNHTLCNTREAPETKGCLVPLPNMCGGDNNFSEIKGSIPVPMVVSGSTGVGPSDCEMMCLFNCSCSAFASFHDNGTGWQLYYGDKQDLLKSIGGGNNILYVRGDVPKSSGIQRKWKLTIIISTVVVLVLLVLSSVWC